jgi:hypothetical protein
MYHALPSPLDLLRLQVPAHSLPYLSPSQHRSRQMMIRIMFGMCSTIARVCQIITTPQTLGHCMSTSTSRDNMLEMTFGLVGRVYLGRWQMDLHQRMSQKKRTKPMRTLMVRHIPYEKSLHPTRKLLASHSGGVLQK